MLWSSRNYCCRHGNILYQLMPWFNDSRLLIFRIEGQTTSLPYGLNLGMNPWSQLLSKYKLYYKIKYPGTNTTSVEGMEHISYPVPFTKPFPQFCRGWNGNLSILGVNTVLPALPGGLKWKCPTCQELWALHKSLSCHVTGLQILEEVPLQIVSHPCRLCLPEC